MSDRLVLSPAGLDNARMQLEAMAARAFRTGYARGLAEGARRVREDHDRERSERECGAEIGAEWTRILPRIRGVTSEADPGEAVPDKASA